MAQTFYPITPVEVTPATANAWTDVDVSAYVPAGATGVILHCVNTTASAAFGLRKNGSTDERYPTLSISAHCWAAIGVDADRIFEAYVGSTTNIDVYLVGYTMSGVTFATNATDKSPSSTGGWIDVDCSAQAPSAIGLIFEVVSGIAYATGMRKNGSSDSRVAGAYNHTDFGWMIGCDTGQVYEGYIGNTVVHFWLVGYITDGCTFNTNATDVSLGTTGSFYDLAALPANSVMGFIEVNLGATKYKYGLQKKGSGENIYYYAVYHPCAFVECDANRIIEGKIENVAVDFFVVGYATAAGPIIIERTSSEALGTISDATARAITRAALVSEVAISVADSAARAIIFPKAINEPSISVSDSPAYNLRRAVAISEPSVSVSDAIALAVRRIIGISEPSISAIDAIATAITRAVSISEVAISVADSPAYNLLRAIGITEPSISVADAISLLLRRIIDIAEPSISASDGVVAIKWFPFILRDVNEPAISVADALTYILRRDRQVSELAIAMADILQAAVIRSLTLSELGITVADAIDYLLQKTIAVSEPAVTVSDLVAASHVFPRDIIESLGAAGVFPIVGGSHIIEIIGED